MRKLIEFLFGGIIEEIALARADQIIEEIAENHVGSIKEEAEMSAEAAIDGVRELCEGLERRIDKLDGRLNDIQSEVDATKEEVDDMKGVA